MLDSDGKPLYSQKGGEFEKARALAPEDLQQFLNKWKPVHADSRYFSSRYILPSSVCGHPCGFRGNPIILQGNRRYAPRGTHWWNRVRQVNRCGDACGAGRILPFSGRSRSSVVRPGSAICKQIVRCFGPEVLDEDGTVNRGKLAGLVFPSRIQELNAIVHPEIVKRQNSWMAELERTDPNGIAVVEAALLIEAGAAKDFDKVIVVTCDFERKVHLFAARTGLPPKPLAPKSNAAARHSFLMSRRHSMLITSFGIPAPCRSLNARLSKSGQSCGRSNGRPPYQKARRAATLMN